MKNKLLILLLLSVNIFANETFKGLKEQIQCKCNSAFTTLEKSCNEDNAKSCLFLAYMYEDGYYPDIEKANTYYKKACSLNEEDACQELKSGR